MQVRPPRPTTIDPGTGNPRPGGKPDAIHVMGSLEQRYPRTEQSEVGLTLVDEDVLMLEPATATMVPGGITEAHKVIGPDGAVWSIVRVPRLRRPRRTGAPLRYVALIVRRSTDIEEQ